MSTVSTFSGFTMARLGIMAAQKALEVTGNNISNINTVGYTRQKLDQRALYIGNADRYASQFDVRVGSGALTTGVSQLRDPYLDIRYRNESSNVGYYDGKLSILESLTQIFDEVGKGNEDSGVIEAAFNDLLEQLQSMNTEHAGIDEYDSLVRESADSLVGWFHTYAEKLEKLQANTENQLREDISRVNNILNGIRELNEQIKKAEISSGALSQAEKKDGMLGERGSQALELRDERNLLIDELAQYMDIDVTYSDEPIGAGMYVEKLTITLTGGDKPVLIDGIYGTQVSIQQVPKKDENGNFLDENGNIVPDEADAALIEDPAFKLHLDALTDRRDEKIRDGKKGSKPVDLGELDLQSGSLQATREMLTRNGEYSTNAEVNPATGDPMGATKRGIPYYQKALDALAKKFAKVFNDANMFKAGDAMFDDPKYADYVAKSGCLFSSVADGDVDTGITAKNIFVSSKWAHGEVQIIQTRDPNEMKENPDGTWSPLTSVNSNIAHLISSMQGDFEYSVNEIVPNDPKNPGVYYTGTFQGMLTYINQNLAQDTKATTEKLTDYSIAANDLNVARDSVAGVDLNEEAMNMIQFQKAYSASCRLLTTLDEALDKLINGTGIAGR